MFVKLSYDSNGSGCGELADGRYVTFFGAGQVPLHAFLRTLGLQVQVLRTDNGSRRGVPVAHSAPVQVEASVEMTEAQWAAFSRFGAQVQDRETALEARTSDPGIRSYLQYWNDRGVEVC